MPTPDRTPASTPDRTPRKIAVGILGAGIGGTALALALGLRGHRATVFERAEGPGDVGAGIQIGPNGARILSQWGLGAKVAAIATTPEAVILADGRSARAVARVPMGEAAEARWGAPFWQCHRADLLACLQEAAGAAGAEIQFGAPAAVAADGAPRLTCGATTHRFDAVIAADGVRSPARAALGLGQEARFLNQIAWRALIPFEALPPDAFPRAATVLLGAGRHAVLYPLAHRRVWNLVAVEAHRRWTDEGWSTPGDPDALRAAFAGWCPALTRALAAVEAPILWGLFGHPPLPAWHRGATALLGDAVHPMLPFLAQGATMAIEDAWVLADALSTAPTVPAALAAYQALRAPRTRRVQRHAARNAWVYHAAPPFRAPFHLALGALSHGFPTALVAGFDWLYGHDVTA